MLLFYYSDAFLLRIKNTPRLPVEDLILFHVEQLVLICCQ